ncbi:hypothetical protein ATK36_2301 [Amycolatopsis sulphurea]|uniref:DUF7847 domain-containing protein n=1 Tax=Amycolatopsis sulphurea TaxID=76022 RepID=A0A2A9F8Z3_9PSEU|nr:hypothetical protein [Amycolatopsis sulphurea]PFG47266.1 hypothetical protein ATK36_2301 [Amycolatopsis sulphurea]
MTDTPGSPGSGEDSPTPGQGIPVPGASGAAQTPPPGDVGAGEPAKPDDTAGDAGQPSSGGVTGDSGPPVTLPPDAVAKVPGQPSSAGQPPSPEVPAQPGSAPHADAVPPGWTPPPSVSGQWQAPGSPPPPPPSYQGGHGYGPPRGWNPQGLGKPGVIALRPLNISDLLDGAITAIRRYPLLILGVSAIVAVVTAGLNLVVSLLIVPDFERVARIGPAASQAEQLNALYNLLGSTLLSLVPSLVIGLLGQAFLTGFLTVVMGKAVLGRPVGFRSAMSEAAPRLLRLLVLTVLYGAAVLTACAAGAGVAVLLGLALGPVAILFGVLAVILPVIPYVFWSLAGAALVLERGTIRQAFARSVKLVTGSFWRVFGVLLLAAIIGWLITMIIGIPFSVGSGALSGMFDPQNASLPQVSTGGLVLQSVGAVIASTLVTPFTALVTVLLYIDQRMRREGMDIELARAAGLQPPQAW